ncbi:MAG: tetratricopeptide repeat protein, partial [Polyangiaceae bacterium]
MRYGDAAVMLLIAAGLVACEDATPPPQIPQTPYPTAYPQPTAYPPLAPTATAPPAPTAPPATPPPAAPPPANTSGLPPMSPQAQASYQQGQAAFRSGQLQTAMAYFNQATQYDPRAAQAYYALGTVQERMSRGQAIASYQRAYQIAPKYEDAIVAYGLAMAKQVALSNADSFLTDKRGRLPKAARVAAALAEVKSLQKDTASAQRIAQEALKVDPDCRPAMLTIARDHFRQRRLDLSLYALKAILDGFGDDNPPRDKENAEAHLLRATIWDEKNERAAAMGAYKKVVQLRPDIVVARLKLATYLLESGDAQEALPVLQQALSYDPSNIGLHLSIGDALRLMGRFDEAKKEFEWVAQRDSALPQVHYNLGLLYVFAPKVSG